MNPELLRNLWLQFSSERIAAAPLILGAIFVLAALATDSWDLVGRVADGGYIVIAYLWGARRAVNVLADEIAAGTWDGQRMSSIAPWTMTWGKLLGGTAYVWYCALLCLAAYVTAQIAAGRQSELLVGVLLNITGALLVQATALLFALVLAGKGRRPGRRAAAFAQGGALFIALFGVLPVFVAPIFDSYGLGAPQTVTWFGVEFSSRQFTLLTQVLFLAWAIVGLYRLMASELQVRQWPWVWSLFSLFLIGYYQGFLSIGGEEQLFWRSATAMAVAVPLYYLAIFAQSSDPVRYRWLLHHARGGAWRTVLSLMPLWMPSFVIAVVAAVLVRTSPSPLAVMHLELGDVPLRETSQTAIRAMTTALVFFMLRDLGFVLLLNFAKRPRAPDLTALLYLVVLYVVCGGLAVAIGARALLPWFLPGGGTDWLVVQIAPLVEAIAVASLVVRRWTAQTRTLQLRPAG